MKSITNLIVNYTGLILAYSNILNKIKQNITNQLLTNTLTAYHHLILLIIMNQIHYHQKRNIN